jgi:hypothetical protein
VGFDRTEVVPYRYLQGAVLNGAKPERDHATRLRTSDFPGTNITNSTWDGTSQLITISLFFFYLNVG